MLEFYIKIVFIRHFESKFKLTRRRPSSPALLPSLHHDSGLYLVNEVERHSPLADPHLLGLPVLVVLAPDAVHALLQSTCCLVLLPVLLPLQSTHTFYDHDHL